MHFHWHQMLQHVICLLKWPCAFQLSRTANYPSRPWVEEDGVATKHHSRRARDLELGRPGPYPKTQWCTWTFCEHIRQKTVQSCCAGRGPEATRNCSRSSSYFNRPGPIHAVWQHGTWPRSLAACGHHIVSKWQAHVGDSIGGLSSACGALDTTKKKEPTAEELSAAIQQVFTYVTQAEPAPLQRLAVVGAQLYVTAMQLLEAGKKHAVAIEREQTRRSPQCSETVHSTRVADRIGHRHIAIDLHIFTYRCLRTCLISRRQVWSTKINFPRWRHKKKAH